MHEQSRFSNPGEIWTAFLLIAAILALSITLLVPAAEAATQHTAFLPLKINAPDQNKIAQLADAAMQKELGSANLKMIPREEAEKMVNYSGPWPPSSTTLSALVEKSGFNYVGLGSLTIIGDQISIDYMVFDNLSPESPFTSYIDGINLSGLDKGIQRTVANILKYTNSTFLIASIAPAGNKRVDSGAILQKISTKQNDLYNPVQLRKDLKSVFSMGYFDNVEIRVNDTAKGKEVTFFVQEKPVISKITINGSDEIEEKDIKDAINIKPNTILNSTQLKVTISQIQELYKEKGFNNATISTEQNSVGEDEVEVIFNINEGPKIYIEKILFTGNVTFESKELEDVIETATRGWFSWFTDSGILKKDMLKQDMDQLTSFYNNHGFLEVKVGDPVVEQTGDSLTITYPIDEGTRYRVGTVSIGGDLITEKDTLLQMLEIRKEQFLNRQTLRNDMLKLVDYYSEQGYAFADARPSVRKSSTGKRMDIHINLEKGPLVYFNRVEITGNTRTRDNVIRRELKMQEGGLFNSKAIRSSNTNLQRLGFFDEVNIKPQPNLSENLMDVTVDVKEKSTGQFSIGAGYSSAEDFLFMAEISENNLFGTGNRLALSANMSGSSTKYNLAFTNPRLLDSYLSGGIDLFKWDYEYDDYTKESTGGGLRFGHPLAENLKIYYNYSWTDTTLSNVSDDAAYIIRASQDIHVSSAFKVSLVHDTRNRYFFPDDGSRNKISVEYAGGPLGGDASFTKIEASSSWFFPLPFKSVFHIKGSAGQAFENEGGKLPVYEHFYLGGLNSIRGFESTHVSPKDPDTDERIGGDKMWFANFEIIFPLFAEAGVQGVIFSDVGNVYGTEEDWNFSSYKKTAGMGIRWLSPMGPLRLEWGYNLDPDEGEDNSVWDFSIGGTF